MIIIKEEKKKYKRILSLDSNLTSRYNQRVDIISLIIYLNLRVFNIKKKMQMHGVLPVIVLILFFFCLEFVCNIWKVNTKK